MLPIADQATLAQYLLGATLTMEATLDDHFGFAIRMTLPSEEAAKKVMALWDGGGEALAQLNLAIALMGGEPPKVSRDGKTVSASIRYKLPPIPG